VNGESNAEGTNNLELFYVVKFKKGTKMSSKHKYVSEYKKPANSKRKKRRG